MGKHFDLRLTSILLGLLILNRLTSSSILLSLSGLQLAQDQPGSYSHACMRAKFTTTERNNLLSKALHIGAEGRNIKRRRHRRAVIDLKTGATFTTKHKLVMNMHFYVCVCSRETTEAVSWVAKDSRAEPSSQSSSLALSGSSSESLGSLIEE